MGMTPLDLAVNPRVRDYLFRHGGRITRAGIYGQRVLCDVQETFDQFKDIDEGFSPFTPFMKEFSTDEVDSASVSMMQIDRQKSRLPDSSKNTIVAADFSNSPIPWEKSIPAIVHGDPRESPFTNFSKITGGAIDASYSPVFLQEPTRAPIYENIEGLKFAKSSKKKGRSSRSQWLPDVVAEHDRGSDSREGISITNEPLSWLQCRICCNLY